MKKIIRVETRPRETGQEELFQKDWRSLGVRAAYWTGSPWRALGMMLRKDVDA